MTMIAAVGLCVHSDWCAVLHGVGQQPFGHARFGGILISSITSNRPAFQRCAVDGWTDFACARINQVCSPASATGARMRWGISSRSHSTPAPVTWLVQSTHMRSHTSLATQAAATRTEHTAFYIANPGKSYAHPSLPLMTRRTQSVVSAPGFAFAASPLVARISVGRTRRCTAPSHSPFVQRGRVTLSSSFTAFRCHQFSRPLKSLSTRNASCRSLSMSGTDEREGPGLIVSLVAIGMIIILAVGSLGPIFGGDLTNQDTYQQRKAKVDSKLHSVPVFVVSDSEGRPFLVESEDSRTRRGYFFVDPEDAQSYLARVKEDTDDARVLPIALDDAMALVLQQRASGAVRELPEVFSIFPSEREVENAAEVLGKPVQEAFGREAVPLFYMDGLALSAPDGASSQVSYPLFFDKELLDEMVASAKTINAEAMSNLGATQVLDLVQTVREMRAGTNKAFENIMFVPSEDAILALKKSAE